MRTGSWRRLVAVGLAAATLGVLAGCGSSASGSSSSSSDTASGATVTPKPGSTIQAVVGKPFVVKLESNTTTNYEWYVKQAPPQVVFMKSDNEGPKSGRLGAPGPQLLTFKATTTGTWAMELAYDLSTAPTTPSKTLSFSVHAKKS